VRHLFLVLTACSAPAAPPEAPKGPKPCERVADHLVGLMTAGMDETERPTETIDKLTKVIIQLCTDGKWSADAQACFLKVGSLAEEAEAWDRCATMLTIEQRDALPKAIDAAFGPAPDDKPPPPPAE
jgi:hypothetical protein